MRAEAISVTSPRRFPDRAVAGLLEGGKAILPTIMPTGARRRIRGRLWRRSFLEELGAVWLRPCHPKVMVALIEVL
jgi:hypothetical protein